MDIFNLNFFEVLQPQTVKEACQILSADPENAIVIGGGTDLLSLIKDGIQRPRKLVSLTSITGLSGIRFGSTIRIGASTTLDTISRNSKFGHIFPSVSKAITSIGTQQIRNVATLGGNLCQRPRCLYFRAVDSHCLKQGGKQCNAVNGYNKNLAIFQGGPAHIVHNSDSAPALIASNAQIEITGEQGSRTILLEDFFVNPRTTLKQETILGIGEIATAVYIPRPQPGTTSMYLKIKSRNGDDFALVNLALQTQVLDHRIRSIHLIAGNVAPKPYRVQAVENHLMGKLLPNIDTTEIMNLLLETAHPLSSNGYKIPLLANLIRSAVEKLKTENYVTKEDENDKQI
jgi:xanthine dehydrogenase YagS FAD-binding subunit